MWKICAQYFGPYQDKMKYKLSHQAALPIKVREV